MFQFSFLQNIRILIVEDEDHQSSGMFDVLSKCCLDPNKDINCVQNAEECQEELKKFAPDLIILDICLSGDEDKQLDKIKKDELDIWQIAEISGIKLLSWLRSNYQNIPVILASAYYDGDLPFLPHSSCIMTKEQLLNPDYISEMIIKVSLKTIIGVKLNRKLSNGLAKEAEKITKKINEAQNLLIMQIFFCKIAGPNSF